ncbi:hypothetical protein Kpho02_45860 [Kitasatospora phosalacinea]|uniref:Uncharacterized protein n=1 Tax=Kitasatospora phosalacinea TaxID=2065 RepID=A0A9W6V4J5_9ACTN|nr:hypothetical protein Kpho02_45860 [Kitasatospora phosalacinea]
MPERAFACVAEIVRLTLAAVQEVKESPRTAHANRTHGDDIRPATLPRLDFLQPAAAIRRRARSGSDPDLYTLAKSADWPSLATICGQRHERISTVEPRNPTPSVAFC